MKAGKIHDKAVKIDAEIASKATELISRKENKIKYASLKQFIDIAVLEKLEREAGIREEKQGKTKELIKLPELSNKELTWRKEAKVPSGII